jgi:HEAT repeat protein
MTNFEQLLIENIPKELESYFDSYHQAIEKIVALNINSPDELLNTLNNSQIDVQLRREIIPLLTWIDYKPAIRVFTRIANDMDESIQLRRTAMIYLRSLAPKSGLKTLKLLLSNPNPSVRLTAISVLQLNPSRYTFKLATEIVMHQKDIEVRREATRILGSVASLTKKEKQSGLQFLSDRIADKREDATVKAYAIEALGNMRDEQSFETFIKHLSHRSPEIRYMSAYALGEVGDVNTIPILEQCLKDTGLFESWGTVADAAVEAIKIIKQKYSDLRD